MKKTPDNPDPLHIGNVVPEVLKQHGMVIPAVYNGIQYRSRLEARWAVFFDTLNLQFDYEPEGWDFGGLKYLPDFWFPDLGFYVEIKPEKPSEVEERKAEHLAIATHRPVYLFHSPFVSIPESDEVLKSMAWIPEAKLCDWLDEGIAGWDESYYWCECPACGAVGIECMGRADRICRHDSGDRGENAHSDRLMMAYRTARSARFWK